MLNTWLFSFIYFIFQLSTQESKLLQQVDFSQPQL